MVLKKIGDQFRNHGMLFTLTEVDLDKNNRPIYFLRREFDGSLWYTNRAFVTRLTNLRRLYDRAHAYMDRYDVMASINEAMRRL